jgi:hypothetical protein
MAAFIITYDLNKGDRRSYQTLYDVLKNSGAVRATESSWLFASSTWSAVQIGEHLKEHMHERDVLTVNVLTVGSGFYSDKLSPAAVAWMNKHLKLQSAAIRRR